MSTSTPTLISATVPGFKPARFKNTILINPPNPPGYVSNKDSMGGFGQLFPIGATLFPPMDLVYLASYLDAKKIPMTIIECLGLEQTTAQLVQQIAALDHARALVVVRTSAPTLDWDLAVCREIKTIAPHACIAIYGPSVPHALWRIQQEAGIAYIVRGEPEETVYELMTASADENIRGLTWRADGKWLANPERPAQRNLDALPFPKWELVPYKKYRIPKSSARATVPFLPVLTSRGCPVGCHYCPYPVGQGLLWRWRSPGNVVDEIEHLVRDLGIQHIIFRDPMFSLNQKRVVEICDELKRRDLVFEWRCETRVDFLKEETLRAMAGAGCVGVNFGVESADVAIQAHAGRRPIAQEEFVKTIGLCRQLGIKTFAFFIIGLPGDTLETTLKTIKFAIDIRTTWVQFTAASPFIGTQLRAWAIEHHLISQDDYAYINSHLVLMGNENLAKAQVKVLLDFAQVFENYLINRKGILKDEQSPSRFYRALQAVADALIHNVALSVFAIGQRRLRAQFRSNQK